MKPFNTQNAGIALVAMFATGAAAGCKYCTPLLLIAASWLVISNLFNSNQPARLNTI